FEQARTGVLAAGRQRRLRTGKHWCHHQLIAEHEAVQVQVMAVELPAPRSVQRWSAEETDPVQPFTVLVGLVGQLLDRFVELHHIARSLEPWCAERASDEVEGYLPLRTVE